LDRRLVALLESSSDSLGNVIASGELLRTFATNSLTSYETTKQSKKDWYIDVMPVIGTSSQNL
jgi:hypothetical protein